MKKWISIVIFILVTTAIIPSTGCTSRAIAVEAAQSLIQMNKGAVENIDSEIAKTDRQLYDTQVKLSKLEQVLNAAMEWIDYQKEVARPGKFDIKVLPSGLLLLQNDEYSVTSLEAIITKDMLSVTDLSYTLEVRDSMTMQTEDGNTLKDNLTNAENLLQQNRQAMVDARDLSISTVNNILKYVNDWKIKKVSGATYSVSGPGLGWSEKLTNGSWTYNRDTGTLAPDDKQAEDLNSIILVTLSSGK